MCDVIYERSPSYLYKACRFVTHREHSELAISQTCTGLMF